MSLAILHCRAQYGIDAPPVTIEVFLSGGLPAFTIVGMAETAVRESKDRVRGALLSSGFEFPQQRITISLGPADMRKTGRPLRSCDRTRHPCGTQTVSKVGPGQSRVLRRTGAERRAAVRARHAAGCPEGAAKRVGGVVVPTENRAEASLAGADVYAASSLLEVTAHLAGQAPIMPLERAMPGDVAQARNDLIDVKGQQHAKRALEIAAAGGHNLLFVGPPGTGKSMLARRLPGLLPSMSEAEALETAAIDSVLGKPLVLPDWRRRPFRSPHHTASAPALVGGGPGPRPGEVSRAHNGVLFLDELPEFNRNVLEVLREPMETGVITISRAARQAEYPAKFQLIAAMNPCPCGYLGDSQADCRCSGDRVASYRGKISGPLLDRIDLHVEVTRPATTVLRSGNADGESSATVAARIKNAWCLQMQRSDTSNARLEGEQFAEHCDAGDQCWALLENAAEQFNLSARAHQRVLRVSRTIADLSNAKYIRPPHVAEALSMRCLDRRP